MAIAGEFLEQGVKAGSKFLLEGIQSSLKGVDGQLDTATKVWKRTKQGRNITAPQTWDGLTTHVRQQPDLKSAQKEIQNIGQVLNGDDLDAVDRMTTLYAGEAEKIRQGEQLVQQRNAFRAKPVHGKMNRQGKAGAESGEDIASKFVEPEDVKDFNKKYGNISRRKEGAEYTSPFAPHHLVPHEDGARINNRNDAQEVWREVDQISRKKRNPGNTPSNLIASMHRKNAAFIQSGKDSIIQQKPEWKNSKQPYTWNDPYLGEMTSTPDRILKDISKDAGNAPYPSVKNWSSIGLPENGIWPHNGKKVTANQKAAAWRNRYEYHGIDRKKVKFDPKGDILGNDHVEIGHRAVDLHPDYMAMQNLLDDPERYLSMTPKEVAPIIEAGLAAADNVFININKLRLDFIKERLGFLIRTGNDKAGRPKFKVNKTIAAQYEGQMTERIVTWIHDNPAEAASLGWKELSGDLEKMLKWLSKDPGNTTDEFNTVFSYEEAMNSQLKEVSPGVMYSGSSKDPAVNALLEKLKRDGADSLDSSGFGGQVGGDLQRIVND